MSDYDQFIKNICNKSLCESKVDIVWLASVGRLAVRTVVRWNCYVTTKMCPFDGCGDEETFSAGVSEVQTGVGENHTHRPGCGHQQVSELRDFKERSAQVKELYWHIICAVISEFWKTKCVGILEQKILTSKSEAIKDC